MYLTLRRFAGAVLVSALATSVGCGKSSDRRDESESGTGGAGAAAGDGSGNASGTPSSGASGSGGTAGRSEGGTGASGTGGTTGGASGAGVGGAAAGKPGSGGTESGGTGAGGSSGGTDGGADGLAGESAGGSAGAGGSDPSLPSDLLCGERPGGSLATDNVVRFENAAGTVVVQLRREYERHGGGFSIIYALGAFDLLLDGAPICITGDSLAYTNTHHNSNDVAEAEADGVHYAVIYDEFSEDTPDYRLVATDGSGATLLDEELLPTGGPACWTCGFVEFSELMVNNVAAYADENGEFEPWVEIYNSTGDDLDLTGYSLSNDFRDRRRWALPPVVIPGGGVVIVFADGEPEEGPLHASFELSPDGGELILTWPDGRTDGGFVYGPIPEDTSVTASTPLGGTLVPTDAPSPGMPE